MILWCILLCDTHQGEVHSSFVQQGLNDFVLRGWGGFEGESMDHLGQEKHKVKWAAQIASQFSICQSYL